MLASTICNRAHLWFACVAYKFMLHDQNRSLILQHTWVLKLNQLWLKNIDLVQEFISLTMEVGSYPSGR